jgi:uncharacterized protein YndB with AHSA1/START domain
MTAKRKIVLERTFDASLDDVWEMWTTKEGFESWWGPIGFTTTVHRIDLRAGGEIHYTMAATAKEQVAFMTSAKMPLAQDIHMGLTEVMPKTRLAWKTVADFVPGVAPYDVASRVELFEEKNGIRMLLTHDALHDDTWTDRARMGWEQQLGRLADSLKR